MPLRGQAQTIGGWADELQSLHSVLEQLYNEMLPMCSELIGVGRGLAGFAALWYIAARVWGHISRAESIDFYPLFRPFVIGFAIAVFPSVIALSLFYQDYLLITLEMRITLLISISII
jgi:hypothetical protein